MVFYHTLDPILFGIGPVQIHWYALMYVFSFIIVYFYVRSAVKHKRLNLSLDDVDNLMVILTVSMIVGARLFEVLFYNPSYYFSNPAEIIAVWHGGLSFHGGLVGMVLSGYWFARRKKVSFLRLCDIFVIPLALAQALGRIGNFINGELYGTITSLPWGVKFPNAEGFRHPSQLYEALYDLAIFSFLFIQRNKNYANGVLFSWFLILYPVFRFMTEFVREPEIMIGPITLGQLLCVPMFIAGIGLLYYIKKLKKSF